MSVPEGGTEVRLDFEGIAGSRDFHNVHPDKAGWRYGFVAVTTEGKRVYGNMNRGENGMNRTASFSVPQNTQFLWLVVTGAPTAHWETHRNGEKKGEETQWPYRIRLDGTSVHPSVLK